METILQLRAVSQNWHLKYLPTDSHTIRHCVSPGHTHNVLTLYGKVKDQKKVSAWLKKWLSEKAKKHFTPWLYSLSQTHNLPFNKVSIRGQKTLWGSCSSDKNISLNYKLLFLPENYVTHLMLHELCHTKHLNHGKKFWDLLAKLDNNSIEHNNAIRKADSLVPIWLWQDHSFIANALQI